MESKKKNIKKDNQETQDKKMIDDSKDVGNSSTMATPSEGIKSTAVVKYSVPKPAKFLQLQCNTDLKVPPSNWLTNSTESYGLQHVLYSHKEFSSFRMAHMFPDCVGEVDVVSDSENIKNLLKIPYNKDHIISMMVHRVENTLLLDDFDMYKHLLRTAETEWEWLRKFFDENVESEILDEERLIYIKNKRQKALKQKHLVSKFLYHSLVQDAATEVAETHTNQHQLQGPSLPEPPPSEETPDSSSFEHKYNRNVVWTFEDIEMLIGTDMPIFGGSTHPCISLRLRDMKKPINVLTGIDYWLDNLMSNVPEVVMCYHLDGIVQKYELIKTEDLPSLKDSKFNPELIRDVAQSILSFLKSNATKAGHTYWLFKGKDEDVVKLYDLTSLCSNDNDNDDTEQNPFTVPVAMLLYRVARNMKHSREPRQPGTIRMLLKNCIKLLNEEKYPEIVTSSHYMLSDLYIPADTNPESPKLDCPTDEELPNDDFWNYGETHDKESHSEDIKTLTLSDTFSKGDEDVYKHPPPIAGGVEERSLQALVHVQAGINCLQYFKLDFEKEQQLNEEANIPMARQNEPIPMPYEKINKEKDNQNLKEKEKEEETHKRKKGKKKKVEKEVHEGDKTGKPKDALLLKNKAEAQPLPTWQGPPKGEMSWKEHLKTLLYEKAVLVYAILSEDHYGAKNYGSSLRYLGLLVRTMQVMSKLKYSVCTLKESCILGRAGDCCVMIAQTWDKGEVYRNQFHTHTDEDLKMLELIETDEQVYNIQLAESSTKCVFIYDIRTVEQILLKAIECYKEALHLTSSDCLLRRLANSLNEVGSFYLNKAKTASKEDLTNEFCKKSEPYLKQSVDIFERIKDEANVALVYTNIGHLHRLLAHANTPNERGELTTKEKIHYNKAFTNYNKALQVIGDRKHCPNIWDAVKWELSTALFTMATILHENPAADNIQETEKEVIEVFQRALKACDFDENNPKYPLYQYRAATIYYRLGSLYHKHIWAVAHCNEANRKNIIQLSKLNYEKAAKMFFLSMDCINYLTAQMQRFALTEYIAETATNTQIKYKHLQQCLDILVEIGEMIHQVVEGNVDVPADDVQQFDAKKTTLENYKSCSALLILVKQRLQHVLKILIKVCLQKPPINKETPKYADLYKSCYAATFGVDRETSFMGFAGALDSVLRQIDQQLKHAK